MSNNYIVLAVALIVTNVAWFVYDVYRTKKHALELTWARKDGYDAGFSMGEESERTRIDEVEYDED